jgi:pyruvyl transferase EpsO
MVASRLIGVAGPALHDATIVARHGDAHAQTMRALSRRLDAIAALLPPGAGVAYLDIPDHGNVGDRLNQAGADAFLARHGVRVRYRATVDDFRPDAMARLLRPGETIVLHGGGNFGTLWPRHQAFREQIVRRYPAHPVLVLPQSIHFESARAQAASAAIFRTHPRLAICVRDTASEEAARAFAPTVLRVPDMAHALWGRWTPGPPTRREPLVIARTDHEAAGGAAMLATVGGRHTDWPVFLGAAERQAVHRLRGLHRRLRRSALAPWLPAALSAGTLEADLLIARAVRLVARHPVLLTDRLHGVLLATLLGRPVRYADNRYGKLSRYVEDWLPGLPTVRPLDRPGAAGL